MQWLRRISGENPKPGMRSAVPVQFAKTEAPLIEPGKDDGRGRRLHIPGRNNLLKVGTVLQNRYRVLDIRGVGGMSTVYKSRDLRFTSVDRLCAIKEMFNSAEDAKLRQVRLANFQREASLLATLTHSSIPRIYDYFEQQGTIYLVLELIHGEDLETLLSQNGGPFEQEKVIDWGIALCSVIAYLHNQRPEPIIFRDLKPSNIMIRAEDDALMLVDFGIARTFAPQQKGTMIGTEGYAPPEQYKGVADDLMKAQASARMASEQRAERLSLVEPADLPDQPNWPNRPLLIAAGTLAGAVLGLLLALIVEILKRPLRSPVQLEGLGLPVVGIVPIIDRGAKRRWWQLFRRQEAELA